MDWALLEAAAVRTDLVRTGLADFPALLVWVHRLAHHWLDSGLTQDCQNCQPTSLAFRALVLRDTACGVPQAATAAAQANRLGHNVRPAVGRRISRRRSSSCCTGTKACRLPWAAMAPADWRRHSRSMVSEEVSMALLVWVEGKWRHQVRRELDLLAAAMLGISSTSRCWQWGSSHRGHLSRQAILISNITRRLALGSMQSGHHHRACRPSPDRPGLVLRLDPAAILGLLQGSLRQHQARWTRLGTALPQRYALRRTARIQSRSRRTACWNDCSRCPKSKTNAEGCCTN